MQICMSFYGCRKIALLAALLLAVAFNTWAAPFELSFTWRLFAPQPEPPKVAIFSEDPFNISWGSELPSEPISSITFDPAAGPISMETGVPMRIGTLTFVSGANSLEDFAFPLSVPLGVETQAPFAGVGIVNFELLASRSLTAARDAVLFAPQPDPPIAEFPGATTPPLLFSLLLVDPATGALISGELPVEIGGTATADVYLRADTTPIPEPAAAALCSLGLISLLLWRRRRC